MQTVSTDSCEQRSGELGKKEKTRGCYERIVQDNFFVPKERHYTILWKPCHDDKGI